jgi:hypothetical protein
MALKLFLKVTFDVPNQAGIFEDISSYVSEGYDLANIKGLLKITYPDGLEQDFSSLPSPPLSASNSLKFSNDLRTDADGDIMQGEYVFVYKSYDGSTLIDTITRTVTFGYDSPELLLVQNIDTLTPDLSVADGTSYSVDGFSVTASKVWEREAPSITSTKYISGGDSVSLGIPSEFYSTVYEVKLDTSLIYAGVDDDWFNILDAVTKTITISVYEPLMIPEILALINCLYAKRKAMDCCKDAQYDLISADYELVMGLFSNFVTNGQADITSGQSDLLTEMLDIFKKWGCADDGTISDTALSGYDWCLCDGGGGSGGKFNYSAGNGAMVSSDVDDDVTFAKASGVGTFTAATGNLLGGVIRGVGADATYDSNGATQSFKVVIPVKDASLAYATLLCSLVQVWDAANSGSISDATPLVMDEGAVQKRIVGIGSNTVSLVFTGIGATYSAGWLITFTNP